jgi:putative ABC transport system permease protein
MSWFARLSNIFRQDQVSQQISEEIDFHLLERVDELVQQGVPEKEARAQAARQFGNPTLQKEQTREMDVLGWIEALGKNLRYGSRMLARDPGFATAAVLTLGLGIGINTSIFSVISARLLKPLPYEDADRLVMVRETRLDDPRRGEPAAVSNFIAWRERNRVFEHIGTVNDASLSTIEDEPQRLIGLRVQHGYLEALGAKPVLGRLISATDCIFGNGEVVVLSHQLWQRRYAGDPHVLGKIIPAGLRNFTIIGVLPPDFQSFAFNSLQPDVEFWIPYEFTKTHMQSRTRYVGVIGRLKNGISLEQAQAEMTRIASNLAEEHPERNKGWGVKLVPITEAARGNMRQGLLTLQGAVAFVLLLACANVAGLLLARLSSRQHEIAMRAALGAGRGRLIFQFLTESIMISVLSTPLALLIAYGGTRVLARYGPEADFSNLAVDHRVLAFAALLSILTGLMFGLLPAVQAAGRSLTTMLQDSGRAVTTGFSRQRLRGFLVVSTIAIALVLLTGTGLMVNSFIRLVGVNPGFDTKNLLTFELLLSTGEYFKDEGTRGGIAIVRPSPRLPFVFEQLLERLSQLPGVESAALSDTAPLSGGHHGTNFTLDTDTKTEADQLPSAVFHTVSVNFFDTLKVPLLQGRAFDSRDSSNAPWVVIVNESMARKYWPDSNPIGRYLTFAMPGDEQPRQVIGIARDMHYGRLSEESNYEMFVPHTQIPALSGHFAFYVRKIIILRTVVDPMTLIPAARKIAAQVADNRPITDIRTVDQHWDRQFQEPRFTLLLLGVFGGTALLLAAVGIYGVMAYFVKVRTHEIGVRMALGAHRKDVMWMILRHGLTLTFIGVAAGTAGALWLTRFIAGVLFGVEPTDPATFAIVALTMIGVAVLACLIPGRRATNVDPAVALRHD